MKPAVTEAHINNSMKVKNDGIPRQPNERDESPDGDQIEPRANIKQAYDDLQQGMVDTDLHGVRGVEEVIDKHHGTEQGKADAPAEKSRK